jgi:hypothetical protein
MSRPLEVLFFLRSIDLWRREQRILIDRALDLLREALASSRNGTQQTEAVRLALRVLRPHCPQSWLVYFWDACATENEIGRHQSMNAALNGIELRLPGASDDVRARAVSR